MSEPQPDRTEILFYLIKKKKKSHSCKPQNVDLNFGYNPPNLKWSCQLSLNLAVEKFNKTLKNNFISLTNIKNFKVEFNQPSCWLYSVPNLLAF